MDKFFIRTETIFQHVLQNSREMPNEPNIEVFIVFVTSLLIPHRICNELTRF